MTRHDSSLGQMVLFDPSRGSIELKETVRCPLCGSVRRNLNVKGASADASPVGHGVCN